MITALKNCQNSKYRGFGVITDYGNNTLQIRLYVITHCLKFVENLWPNKVEYCISIPNKAIVFGSSIPFEIILLPLLKGLTIGKITCSLKELHNFSVPHKDSNKSDVKTIVTQMFECVDLEDGEYADFGKYKLRDRVELPKSLAQCVQDCETELIKVRHK